MSLGIGSAEEFAIRAEGSDEQEALIEIEKTLQNEGLAK